ncbi:MAG: DUF4326 domain-containing protein [Gammaproteobacteria bacterium]|nr:DUF4326 domain-containing protein [Gammaproteobacteria bacterium]
MKNQYQHPLLHNKAKRTAPPGAVYIGRGSLLGNKFIIGRHGTRDEVCEKYKKVQFPQIVKQHKDYLETLRGKPLECFCSSPNDPHAQNCHGLVILEYLENTA